VKHGSAPVTRSPLDYNKSLIEIVAAAEPLKRLARVVMASKGITDGTSPSYAPLGRIFILQGRPQVEKVKLLAS